MIKKIAALLAAVFVITASVPVFAAYESAEYIALGDSIAAGYGLADPENDSYPAKFAEDNLLDGKNYGISGQTAKELLLSLQNGDYDLSGAAVITVSIGSNELLHYVIDIVAKEFEVDPNTEDVSKAIAEKAKYIMENESSNAMLVHVSNLQYTFENNEELFSICDELRNVTLPAIADEIRKQNSTAQLIFTNIYNPYKNMYVIFPLSATSSVRRNLGNYFQPYIDRANKNFVSTDTYDVADICSVFTKGGYVNADLDMRNMKTFNFDPHPTRSGHTAIKNVINEFYVYEVPDGLIYGDVTDDGNITAADSAAVLQYTLNKGVDFNRETLAKADVNADGKIDAADSAQILQKALVSSYIFNAERK